MHMVIDIRNALYRAVYAYKKQNAKNSPIRVLLGQIRGWYDFISPDSIHIAWDAPRTKVWRRTLLETYKDRTSSQYVDDLREHLTELTIVCKDVFAGLGFRQYYQQSMEADDLVYAISHSLQPEKVVIISTDSDLIQIPYRMPHVSVYDPINGNYTPVPDKDPVLIKALKGDKSDNIAGYWKVGPVNAEKLMDNRTSMQEFLDVRGRETLERNLKLIDLSLNPHLLDNRLYVIKMLSKKVAYNEETIKEAIKKHNIPDLISDLHQLTGIYSDLK